MDLTRRATSRAGDAATDRHPPEPETRTDAKIQLYLQRAAVISLVLTLVAHLLPPVPFAMSELMIDYSHGLLRRAVVGSLFALTYGPTATLGEVYALAFAMTLAAAVALFVWLYFGFRGTTAGMMLLLLFACSFAFASFIGNTGYLDTVLLMVALLAIGTGPAGGAQVALACAAVVFGAFVHESMLPYFAVLIGFAIWLRSDRQASVKTLLTALSPVLAGTAAVAVLGQFGHMPPEAVPEFAADIARRAEFWIVPAATDIAGRSLVENIAHVMKVRAKATYWFWLLLDGGLLLAMSGFMVWLNLCMLRNETALTRLAMIAAVAAPLSLNFVAFDVARFGTASVLSAFICAALILRHVEGAAARLTGTLHWPVFVVVLVLNLQVATMQLNQGLSHTSRFPYVLNKQADWIRDVR